MAISCVIAGVDRSAHIDWSQLTGGDSSYTAALNQRGRGQISIRVHDGDSYQPLVGNPISLYDQNGVRVMGGLISEITRTWEEDTQETRYLCTIVSFERFLDKHLIHPVGYFNQTADFILTDLFANEAAGETIMLGDVEAGPNIPQAVYDSDLLTDAYDALALESGFVWGVDPDTETLYFKPATFTPAPWVLTGDLDTGGTRIHGTTQWTRTQQDFRNTQKIRIALEAFTPNLDLFTGDGVTNFFTLQFPVNRVISAALVSSTRAQVTGTATGQPNPGDTVTIDGIVYEFVSTLDNTVPFKVKIGADANATMEALVEAIGAGGGAGDTFSMPTWPNRAAVASPASGGAFDLFSKGVGSSWNIIAVSSSAANFSWSAATLTGGTDGSDVPISIGVLNVDKGQNLYWRPGEQFFTINTTPDSSTPVPVGQFIAVTYYRLGGDVITTQDSALVAARAAIEGGTGIYEAIMDGSAATDPVSHDPYAAIQKANATLEQFKILPETFTFDTDDPGLAPGQLLTVALPTGSPITGEPGGVLNGTWIIEQVQGKYIPAMKGWRYTVQAIAQRSSPPSGTIRTATTLKFWEKLADIGPRRGGVISQAAAQASSDIEIHIQNGDFDVVVGQDTDLLPLKASKTVTQFRAIAGKAVAGAALVIKMSQNGSDVITISIPIGAPAWVTGTYDAVTFAPSDLNKARIFSMGTAGGLVSILLF